MYDDVMRYYKYYGAEKYHAPQRSMYDDAITYIKYYGPQRRMYDDVMWYYKI